MTRDIITKKIEEHQARTESSARNYIGASIIGSDCLRQIWYEYNETVSVDIPPKTWRTWDIGKRLELLVMDWMSDAGISLGILPEPNLKSKIVPTFRGHVDSICLNENGTIDSIIEIKTAKESSYNVFTKKGLKSWSSQYYAQIQSYMGMSGIHKAYVIVLNKDSSDISDELIDFDEKFYRQLEYKAMMISEAVTMPPRVHDSPIWYQCKTCKFNKICHKKGQ